MAIKRKSYKKAKRKKRVEKGLGYAFARTYPHMMPFGMGQGYAIKWNLIKWTLGTIAAGGVVYLGYRWYRKQEQGKVEEQSLTIGNPENYAMHLKKAFDNDGWPFTNTSEVFRTFNEIPSWPSYKKMTEAYLKLTGNRFEHDLDEEMSLSEVRRLEEILGSKPGAPQSVSLTPAKS